MSDSAHSNTAQNWLIFFFVCFAMFIFGIGLWACLTGSHQDSGYLAAPTTGTGGH